MVLYIMYMYMTIIYKKTMLVRILLTIMAVISVITDCYNDTIEIDDGRIHITLDAFKVLAIIGFWSI